KNSCLITILFIFFVSRCSADNRFRHTMNTIGEDTSGNYYEGQKIRGISSYYGKKFHGRLTASGEVFDMNGMTAAHNTLPFGTIINVKDLDNPVKSIQVRINDRGPFSKRRILDLSYGAAKKLDIIKKGTANVEITILKLGKLK
ncbi:MAG: septal ring lytic transglycosylase RlpA family protein, partial [Calditrichaceae bacterium]